MNTIKDTGANMKENFFKANRKAILKLMLTHLVVTIFGLMVFIPFNLDDKSMQAFLVIGGVFAVGLYMFLIDVDMWYLGAEDKLRVDAGKQSRSPAKGLLIGLVAEIPSFVIGAIFVISYYLYRYYGAYESGAFFASAEAITIAVNLLWNGMYHGISTVIFGGWFSWFYLFIPLLPVSFAGLTCWLGLNGSAFLKPPAREKKQK